MRSAEDRGAMGGPWTTAARVGKACALVGALLAAAVGGAVAPAAPSLLPPSTPRALGETFLGPQMARAEVVMVVGNVAHDYRIDQGRVVASSATSLVLLERDGTRQTVPIGPGTQVYGRPAVAAARAVPVRTAALAIRDGDGPAQVVYTAGAAARLMPPRALGQWLMGVRTARVEAINVFGGAVHDYRIDQGRIVSVSPSALVLLERDGTHQTIELSASTEVWLGTTLAADTSALSPKMTALTIRDGDQPAQSVRVGGVRQSGRALGHPAGGRQ